MTRPEKTSLEDRLRAVERPAEPPADLLDRIRAEIPSDIRAAAAPGSAPRRRFPLAAAASLLLVVGAAVLYALVFDRLPEPGRTPRPAAESPVREEARTEAEEGALSKQEAAAEAADLLAQPEVHAPPAEPPAPRGERDPRDETPAGDAKRVESPAATSGEPGQEPGPEPGPAPGPALRGGSPRVEQEEAEVLRRAAEESHAAEKLEAGEAPDTAEPSSGAGRGRGAPKDQAGVVHEEIVVTSEAPRIEKRIRVGTTARRVAAPPPPLPPPTLPEPASTAAVGAAAEESALTAGDFFRHHGTNPFVETEEDRLSTFGLDVDTGSWSLVRRYLEAGELPPPAAVRLEEMVNAFDYGDPAPAHGDFRLVAEGAPTPFAGSSHRLLRFAIKAREVAEAEREPAVLTLVVDVSGSMAGESLGLVKDSLGLLADRLRADDSVALVTYSDSARVVLAPTAADAAGIAGLRSAVAGLSTEGGTNAEAGLRLGYEVAGGARRTGASNRVVLFSDGVANLGASGPESLLEAIGDAARRGVELSALGIGRGAYNDALLERLAGAGDGRYAYLDDLDEARRVLVEEIAGTLETVGSDARVQVELDPRTVESWRLLGYENRAIADEAFRHLDVDAGEVGAGHAVTALYEVKLRSPEAAGPLARLVLRWRPRDRESFAEESVTLSTGDLASSWESAPPALRLASLVAETAEILRGSYWSRGSRLGGVARRLRRLAREAYPDDERVAELVELVETAARLRLAAEGGG